MKRAIKQFLGGAIIGVVFATFIVKDGFTLPLEEIATELTIVFLSIALLLSIGSFVKLAQLKKQSAKQFFGEDEDIQEDNLYKLYIDASWASTLSLILSLVTACITVITEQLIFIQILSIPVILLALVSVPLVGNYIKYACPNREFPSYNDKKYTKKLFELSDEGERHIMLQGLYSAFSTTNVLLFSSLLLLMFYSVASGESQLFAILIIAIILVIVNTQYFLKIRNR